MWKKVGKKVLKVILCVILILFVIEVIRLIFWSFRDYGKPSYEIILEEIPIDMTLLTENYSLQDLEKMNGDKLDVNYDYGDPETPRNITGVFTTRKILTPEDALYALLSVRDIMKIEETSFACTNVSDWGVEKIYYFQQMHEGVPVESRGLGVIASSEGEPMVVSGRYIPVKELDVNPKLTIEEATESIIVEKGTRIDNYQLVIFEDHLAWKINVRGWGRKLHDLNAFKIYYVDATTGSVLWVLREEWQT